MEVVLSHRALIKHDQVMKAGMTSHSRAVSVNWLILILVVGLIIAIELGHLFAFWLVQQLPYEVMFAIGASLSTTIPALLVLVVVVFVGSLQNWAVRRAYLKNFAKRSIPTEIEATFELLPEGLRLSTDRITIFPRWAAVDAVEWSRLGWVMSADQLTFLIPRTSFADVESERAFVAALLERLPPGTRERCPRAVEFAVNSASA